jgi:3-hydroxyacyl-[acyl-carrier-protein] dehydratase
MGAVLSSPIDLLPHRPPFRFISGIVELDPGRAGEAVWEISGHEEFFHGHFPGDPVVPGVLIVEALAQLSGLVGLHRDDAGVGQRGGRLAHAEVRFDAPVVPPAQIRLRSTVVRSLERLVQFEVAAHVGDRVAAKGSLTLAAVVRGGTAGEDR